MKQIWAGGGGRHRWRPYKEGASGLGKGGGEVATGGDPTRSRKGQGGGRHRWRYRGGWGRDIANDCMK